MPNTIYSSEKVMPYVYMGVHKETGQFYFGYRGANKIPSTEDLGTRYFTSSKKVKELGFDNFNWTILAEFFTGLDAYLFEQSLIEKHISNKPLNLNKRLWGKYVGGSVHSEETKNKIKIKAIGRYHTEETKNKTRGENHYSSREDFIPQTGERNGMFGKTGHLNPRFGLTKETDEACQIISQKLSGEKNPRFGKPGTMLGKKHTPETLQKISLRQYPKGLDTAAAKSVSIGNYSYGTIKECNEETGLSKSFIRRLLKNDIPSCGPCQKLYYYILDYQSFSI